MEEIWWNSSVNYNWLIQRSLIRRRSSRTGHKKNLFYPSASTRLRSASGEFHRSYPRPCTIDPDPICRGQTSALRFLIQNSDTNRIFQDLTCRVLKNNFTARSDLIYAWLPRHEPFQCSFYLCLWPVLRPLQIKATARLFNTCKPQHQFFLIIR